MFKIGEKVSFLYQTGFGIILDFVDSNQVKIEDENGFEQIFNVKELVKIHGKMEEDDSPIIKEEVAPKKQSNFTILKDKSTVNQRDFWELDLHIESLIEDFRGLTTFEIMKTQMQEFKRFFSKAKANQIQKIVIIHGVGEGVLKNEIRNYLAQQEFLEFYDASYLEYGKGATEVKFFIPR